MNQFSPQSCTATGVCQPPDYEPGKTFGKLVDLEGSVNALREQVAQLEQRLGKCLRPAAPVKACPDPSNISSMGDSEIGQQVSTVRGLLTQAMAHINDIYERIDL